MANRWTPGKDWTMISSVRGLISCCFQSSRSASPPPDDHKKHYGSNSQSFIDDKQRVTVDPPSTHSVISCSSRGSGRKRSNRNSGLDGGDSGVISEGAEAGSPQRPRSRSARHSQGTWLLVHCCSFGLSIFSLISSFCLVGMCLIYGFISMIQT